MAGKFNWKAGGEEDECATANFDRVGYGADGGVVVYCRSLYDFKRGTLIIFNGVVARKKAVTLAESCPSNE